MKLYGRLRLALVSSAFLFPILESILLNAITSIHFIIYVSLFSLNIVIFIMFADIRKFTVFTILPFSLIVYFLAIGIAAFLTGSLDRSCWSMFLIAFLIFSASTLTSTNSELDIILERQFFDLLLILFCLFYVVTFLFFRNTIWTNLDSFVMGRIQPVCMALLVLGVMLRKKRYLACGTIMWFCTYNNYQASSNLIGILVTFLILASIKSRILTIFTLLLAPICYAATMLNGSFQRVYFWAYNSGYDNSIIRYRLLEEPLNYLRKSPLFGSRMTKPLHTTDFLEGRDIPFHNDFISFTYATGLLGWSLILFATFKLVSDKKLILARSPEWIFGYSLHFSCLYYGIFNPMFGTFTYLFTYCFIVLVPRESTTVGFKT